MNILVTGASGLIGSALIPSFAKEGHQVTRLARSTDSAGSAEPNWDPKTGSIGLTSAGRIDAVVHLAAHSIGSRWSSRTKKLIRDSRVVGTRLLSEALARLEHPPAVLVSASAVGFYGDRGDDWVDESLDSGQGFLAEVCKEWEEATMPAARIGIRVVLFRLGIVLSTAGGALKQMLPVFRNGLGGRLGDGRQYWSWISIEDAVRAIHHAVSRSELDGPVNAAAPNPVTNQQFTRLLGKSLGRPTVFSVPGPIVHLLFGEMGREALLSSCRAKPSRLIATGFQFRHSELGPAFDDLLEN
jgi:uncharacterized protein (TIGR01777 family)